VLEQFGMNSFCKRGLERVGSAASAAVMKCKTVVDVRTHRTGTSGIFTTSVFIVTGDTSGKPSLICRDALLAHCECVIKRLQFRTLTFAA
jgi:hypothetical protein